MNRIIGTSSSEPPALSPTARTVINMLLFLHLAAVAIIVMARGESGFGASLLQQRLRMAVPGVRQYATLLHNDLAYNYHLTQGVSEDDDHVIELELKQADGMVRNETIPRRGMRPPMRYQHYKMLAYGAAIMVGDPESEARLPQVVAQRWVRETGAVSGRVLVRRHMAQAPEDVTSSDAKRRDPESDNYWSTLYEAQILVADGEVNLLKKASALETAPARRAAGAPTP